MAISCRIAAISPADGAISCYWLHSSLSTVRSADQRNRVSIRRDGQFHKLHLIIGRSTNRWELVNQQAGLVEFATCVDLRFTCVSYGSVFSSPPLESQYKL